jgi:hypothetical protein
MEVSTTNGINVNTKDIKESIEKREKEIISGIVSDENPNYMGTLSKLVKGTHVCVSKDNYRSSIKGYYPKIANEQFYNSNAMMAEYCYIGNNINIFKSMKGEDMFAFIHDWLDSVRIKKEINGSKYILLVDDNDNNTMFTLKVTNDESDVPSLLAEYIIGSRVLNELRPFIPNFIYTLGIFGCPQPFIGKNVVSYCHEEGNSPYILMENVAPGEIFSDAISNGHMDQRGYISYFIQLILSLYMAYDSKYVYNHNNLDMDKVILRSGPSNRFQLEYKIRDRYTYVLTDKVATIIGYEKSSAKIYSKDNSTTIGPMREYSDGINVFNNGSLGDIYTFFMHTAVFVYLNKGNDVRLNNIYTLMKEIYKFFSDELLDKSVIDQSEYSYVLPAELYSKSAEDLIKYIYHYDISMGSLSPVPFHNIGKLTCPDGDFDCTTFNDINETYFSKFKSNNLSTIDDYYSLLVQGFNPTHYIKFTGEREGEEGMEIESADISSFNYAGKAKKYWENMEKLRNKFDNAYKSFKFHRMSEYSSKIGELNNDSVMKKFVDDANKYEEAVDYLFDYYTKGVALIEVGLDLEDPTVNEYTNKYSQSVSVMGGKLNGMSDTISNNIDIISVILGERYHLNKFYTRIYVNIVTPKYSHMGFEEVRNIARKGQKGSEPRKINPEIPTAAKRNSVANPGITIKPKRKVGPSPVSPEKKSEKKAIRTERRPERATERRPGGKAISSPRKPKTGVVVTGSPEEEQLVNKRQSKKVGKEELGTPSVRVNRANRGKSPVLKGYEEIPVESRKTLNREYEVEPEYTEGTEEYEE